MTACDISLPVFFFFSTLWVTVRDSNKRLDHHKKRLTESVKECVGGSLKLLRDLQG